MLRLKINRTSVSPDCVLLFRSRSKEKDSVDPLSEKKKIKEEKEDEKVEDVSDLHPVPAGL